MNYIQYLQPGGEARHIRYTYEEPDEETVEQIYQAYRSDPNSRGVPDWQLKEMAAAWAKKHKYSTPMQHLPEVTVTANRKQEEQEDPEQQSEIVQRDNDTPKSEQFLIDKFGMSPEAAMWTSLGVGVIPGLGLAQDIYNGDYLSAAISLPLELLGARSAYKILKPVIKSRLIKKGLKEGAGPISKAIANRAIRNTPSDEYKVRGVIKNYREGPYIRDAKKAALLATPALTQDATESVFKIYDFYSSENDKSDK